MNDCWLWVQATFSNRQIATGIWLLVAFVYCLFNKSIRPSIGGVLNALVHWKLLLLFASMILNVGALCWLFAWFGLWSPTQLPATILWTVLSGFSLLGGTLSAEDDSGYFKRLVSGCFKATVAVEFLIVGYSFSLPKELLFVPFMAFLAMMIGVSQTKAEHASAKKVLEWLAIAITAALIWRAVAGIWIQPNAFFTTQTGRNFLLPGLLTVTSVPFLYILYCYSQLESASIRINFKSFQSDELKRYAKRRFFIRFICRPLLLRRAVRQFHGFAAETKNDVDRIVSDVLAHERLRKNPPVIDQSSGWSPFLARELLGQEGFESSDYHRAHSGGAWWSDSNRVDLDGQAMRNTARFFVEGTEDVATALRLRGYFKSAPDAALARAC